VTAHAMARDREKCMEAGMDDYVTKPLDREELRAALELATRAASPDGRALRESVVGWDDEEFADLVALLEELAPVKIAEMKRAVEGGNAGDLFRAAHDLKGCCLNFGKSPLVELCGRLEQAGLDGDMGAAGELMAPAAREWRRLSEALSPYRKLEVAR